MSHLSYTGSSRALVDAIVVDLFEQALYLYESSTVYPARTIGSCKVREEL